MVSLNTLVPTLGKLQVRNVRDPDLAESLDLDSLALPLRRYIGTPTRNNRASRSHKVRIGVAPDYETEVEQLRHRLQSYKKNR